MKDIITALVQGIGTTVAITLCSFAVGAVLGLPLALARRSKVAFVRWPAGALVEVLRSIPPLVWLFIAYYSVGVDILPLSVFQSAVLGLGLIAAAYMCEIYRAGLAAVPVGQWEAAQALAMPTVATYVRVAAPQAAVLVIPPAATFLIALLKDSAVASVIGATDITFLAFQEARVTLQGLSVFSLAAALYLLLSVPVAIVARVSDHYVSRIVAR
jgi:polar amino acid transport system permease protein